MCASLRTTADITGPRHVTVDLPRCVRTLHVRRCLGMVVKRSGPQIRAQGSNTRRSGTEALVCRASERPWFEVRRVDQDHLDDRELFFLLWEHLNRRTGAFEGYGKEETSWQRNDRRTVSGLKRHCSRLRGPFAHVGDTIRWSNVEQGNEE